MPHPESKMRASVLAALRKNGFHAEAVDNESCSPGTPDITYCGRFMRTVPCHPHTVGPGEPNTYVQPVKLEGLNELKQLPAWPKLDATVVRIPHFTEKQRTWLRKRWEAGGASSLLLRVGSPRRADWLLFDGEWASTWVGKISHGQLIHSAVDYLTASPLSGPWLVTALAKLHEHRSRT